MNFLEALTQASKGVKVRHKKWITGTYIHFKNGILTDRNYDCAETIAFDRAHTHPKDNEWEVYDGFVPFGSLSVGSKFKYAHWIFQKCQQQPAVPGKLNAYDMSSFEIVSFMDETRVLPVD
jgi:hypothetical protein